MSKMRSDGFPTVINFDLTLGDVVTDGLTVTGNMKINDNLNLSLGTSNDASFAYRTAQTPDTLLLGVSTESNAFTICEKADVTVDFGHAQQTNPTLFIHSADATDTTDWISLAHDQTNAVIETGNGSVQIMMPSASGVITGVSHLLKRFHNTITLDTGDAETDVGLTPSAVIMSAAIRVSTQITGLDSADHHIQLGINGSADKYIDVAQGGAATTIDVNKKGNYTFTTATDTEAAALVLTITEGGDVTPTAGAVEVEVIYLDSADLADV